jgi:hypothetical protein
MANIKSINGNPIVVGTSGIEDDSIPDAKLVQSGGILESFSDLKNNLTDSGYIIYQNFSNVTNGYYIDDHGIRTSNESYSYTQPISVKRGTRVKFKAQGYSNYVSMISKYDNGSYTPLVVSTDSAVQEYIYTTQTDMHIVLCYRTESLHVCALIYPLDSIQQEITSLSNEMHTIESGNLISNYDFENVISGYYITDTGQVIQNESYAHTNPITVLPNTTIEFTARGYSHYVSMISKYTDNGYIPLIISIDSNVHSYSYTTTDTTQLVLSYRIQDTHVCTISFSTIDAISNLSQDVIDIEDTVYNDINYTYLFKKMGGVGDSLMSGELVPNSPLPAKDVYTNSWLSNLSKKASCECEHFSVGGMTTKSWINNSSNCRSNLENASVPCDLYFIALGTNDKNQSVYPLGNIGDTTGTDSFVGYYKQIIDIIHTKNQHAKIFCLSMYDSRDASLPYSGMIADICELFDYCYFVDFANNTEHTPKETNTYAQNSHYTSIGYIYASTVIYKLVNDIINNNQEEFMWSQYD